MRKKPINHAEWENQKEVILDCYIKQDATYDQLISFMGGRGFHASKGQFLRKLKEWKATKNLNVAKWKAIIKQIKLRELQNRPQSDVWFQGRLLSSSTVQKARQRYDLPRLRHSPSPGPNAMEDVQISTPIGSPGLAKFDQQYALPIRCSPSPNADVMEDIQITNPPKFRRRLRECWQPRLCHSLQPFDHQWLKDILPVVLLEMTSNHRKCLILEYSSRDASTSTAELPNFNDKIAKFPIPLRELPLESKSEIVLWIIEFIVIASVNGLLRPYKDLSLGFLVDSLDQIDALDAFLKIVQEQSFYIIIEKILDLKTAATEIFGAQALLSSIEIEDQHLLELLLGRGVPLDGFRLSPEGQPLCALHLAVETQNEKFIRLLLDHGTDPNGYILEEGNNGIKSSDPNPLSRLLHLHSVKNAYRIPRISPTVVRMLLESQRITHGIDHSEKYLAILFLRAWAEDAIDCTEAIQDYCTEVATCESGSHGTLFSHIVAVQKNDDAIVESACIFLGGHPMKKWLGFGLTYRDKIFVKASQRRAWPVLKIILEQNYTDSCGVFAGDYFKTHLDVDTLSWLLDSGLDLSPYFSSLLESSMSLENVFVCQSLLDNHIPQTRGSLPDKYVCKDKKEDLHAAVVELAMHSASHEVAKLIISRYQLYSSPEYLPCLQSYHLAYKSYPPMVKELLNDAHDVQEAQPTGAQLWLLDYAIQGRLSLTTTRAVFAKFKENEWSIDWSKYFGPGAEFSGNHRILFQLLKRGAQPTKEMWYACSESGDVDAQHYLLLSYRPELLSELPHQEVISCFRDLLSTPRKDAADVLVEPDFMTKSQWYKYVTSEKGDLIKILYEGWPCDDDDYVCESARSCMSPLSAAVRLGDIGLVKKMIADGFGTRRQHPSTCFKAPPLPAAIVAGRLDIVRILLQANSDVEAFSRCSFHELGPASLRFDAHRPLEFAASSGHFSIVYELLEAGADINARPSSARGHTALEAAARTGRLDIIHLLIHNNPDQEKLKLDCKRAARRAQQSHNNCIARLLERTAERLVEELGETELDRQVYNLCDCQIGRKFFSERCQNCVKQYPNKWGWDARLVYFTNAVTEWNDMNEIFSREGLSVASALYLIEKLEAIYPEVERLVAVSYQIDLPEDQSSSEEDYEDEDCGREEDEEEYESGETEYESWELRVLEMYESIKSILGDLAYCLEPDLLNNRSSISPFGRKLSGIIHVAHCISDTGPCSLCDSETVSWENDYEGARIFMIRRRPQESTFSR